MKKTLCLLLLIVASGCAAPVVYKTVELPIPVREPNPADSAIEALY